MKPCVVLTAFVLLVGQGQVVHAQRPPEAGYIFPPGGKAGTTVSVRLGGYDWTPDLDFFTHDARVTLTTTGPLGPILIPQPPYWFGAKGRITGPPLAREMPGKLVIPPDLAPGPIVWQAANANGVTSAGVFIVGAGLEVVEEEDRTGPQCLTALPVTVSGRLSKNEEVDQYKLVAAKDGAITCELMARRLGAKFLGVIEVHDKNGRKIADVAGTNGFDPSLTFQAKAKEEFVVNVYDIDFGGDRSYVYRLTITDGPRIVGAIPAAGRRGDTREIEFIVDNGGGTLISSRRRVAFPATGSSLPYRLETPLGTTPPFPLPLSDLPETIARPRPEFPGGITARLDQNDAEDRYFCAWKKGEIWSLQVEARRIGSPLDVAVAILGPDGKELARNEDLPDTTDAGLDFTVPADGTYSVVVSDSSGKGGTPRALYRLLARPQTSDFSLEIASPRLSVPIGGKVDLAVKAIRTGGFKEPITLTVKGLPSGVTVPPNLVLPGDKSDLVISLQAPADTGTGASLATVEGTAGSLNRIAQIRTTTNLAPRSPDENRTQKILVAATMKPRFKGQPVDQDTGRKVHRGSTFPADVIIERLEGYQGEVTLQMAATQSYAHQGITGSEVKVAPGVTKAIYPCYMPEWLESTRTSRMGMVAIAQIPDPKGKVRTLLNDITGFITMTVEGALLKIAADDKDLAVPAGKPFEVHLKVIRLTKLTEPAKLELRLPESLQGKLKAEPMLVGPKQEEVVFRITPVADLPGPITIAIRGTALQGGLYPAISEALVTIEFVKPGPKSR